MADGHGTGKVKGRFALPGRAIGVPGYRYNSLPQQDLSKNGGGGIRTLKPVRAPVFESDLGFPATSPSVRIRPSGLKLRLTGFRTGPLGSSYGLVVRVQIGVHPLP